MVRAEVIKKTAAVQREYLRVQTELARAQLVTQFGPPVHYYNNYYPDPSGARHQAPGGSSSEVFI